jgi:uncharacterized protein
MRTQLYQLEPVSLSSAPVPLEAHYRVIESAVGPQLFVVDGSRLYGVDWSQGEISPTSGQEYIESLLGDMTRESPAIRPEQPVDPPPLHSLSLNVAQSCNMKCVYCYADEGRFGGAARLMSEEVALRAIDRLFSEAELGADVVVGFMGGEPLVNRRLVHRATRYAMERASGRRVRFSLTTNGTLVTEEDAQLFHQFPFTVQVSIDGTRETNDLARPMKDGGSSYDAIRRTLQHFRQHGRPCQMSARVTVTPQTTDLPEILEHLLGLGFDDVGFAPVLVSPNPEYEFQAGQFQSFLAEMIACGRVALDHLRAGRPYAFSNFTTALDEIHRGTHRPYPCGAGAAYLSVNAEGDLFACHRLIDDPAFAMGSLDRGLDNGARRGLLTERHVDRIEPCRSCWARYLCGGGCYHEVTRRGRPGCDYIRGWIEFCISAYAELSASPAISCG